MLLSVPVLEELQFLFKGSATTVEGVGITTFGLAVTSEAWMLRSARVGDAHASGADVEGHDAGQ